MHDTYLFVNISRSLNDICNKNNIKVIDRFTLVVNYHSHINVENLRDYLEIHNNNIIGSELKIVIHYEDIEEQTAIIKDIQGEIIELKE